MEPNGSKLWRQAYRYQGKLKKLAIGVYPIVTLEKTREKRDEAKRLLASGIDPDQQKKLNKLKKFGVVDLVYKAVRKETGARRERYSLYGHSAGAQFVHRFLMLAKAVDADLIISANAGSYSMPTTAVAFPFGIGGVSVSDDDLKRAFGRPVVVLLGEADNDPDHTSLPRQPGAMAQGPHRLARGNLFFDNARRKAAELGVPFNWTRVTVPGAGHSNTGMADRASELVAGVK